MRWIRDESAGVDKRPTIVRVEYWVNRDDSSLCAEQVAVEVIFPTCFATNCTCDFCCYNLNHLVSIEISFKSVDSQPLAVL